MVEGQKLILISKENEQFEVDPAIVNMSILIQNMVEDSGDDYSEPVPIPAVSSKYMTKIIEYCKLHNYQKS